LHVILLSCQLGIHGLLQQRDRITLLIHPLPSLSESPAPLNSHHRHHLLLLLLLLLIIILILVTPTHLLPSQPRHEPDKPKQKSHQYRPGSQYHDTHHQHPLHPPQPDQEPLGQADGRRRRHTLLLPCLRRALTLRVSLRRTPGPRPGFVVDDDGREHVLVHVAKDAVRAEVLVPEGLVGCLVGLEARGRALCGKGRVLEVVDGFFERGGGGGLGDGYGGGGHGCGGLSGRVVSWAVRGGLVGMVRTRCLEWLVIFVGRKDGKGRLRARWRTEEGGCG
ncbi:hypothetical protein QBC34DRAFT_458271, partial [Podospora aff. communis PSN243]